MKKYNKFFSILTITCLLTTTLYGCNHSKTNESETQTAQEETLQMEESIEETFDQTEESGEDVLVEVPSEVDAMRPILKGLCKVLTRGKTYDASDSSFYWEALYASINGSTWVHPDIRLADNGVGYMVPKSIMEEYAAAMFTDGKLPEIPSSVGGIEYDEEEDGYLLYSAGGLAGNMDIMSVNETEDGYEVSVAFHTKKDFVENYTFLLKNGGLGSFPCVVTGLAE